MRFACSKCGTVIEVGGVTGTLAMMALLAWQSAVADHEASHREPQVTP